MRHIFLVFVPIAAYIWAKLEIQIEGPNGWAEQLPTWRIEKHRLLDWFFGGRPLTGYHTWAFAFVGFVFHMPFFWAGKWSMRGESQALGAIMIFWVLEDFLWFVFNPHFGWRKYRKENIWWHKNWVLGFPLDYWVLGIVGSLMVWL